jgi:hypothetical protein
MFNSADLDVLTQLKHSLNEHPLVVRGVAVVSLEKLQQRLHVTREQLDASLGLLESGRIIQTRLLDQGSHLWVTMMPRPS